MRVVMLDLQQRQPMLAAFTRASFDDRYSGWRSIDERRRRMVEQLRVERRDSSGSRRTSRRFPDRPGAATGSPAPSLSRQNVALSSPPMANSAGAASKPAGSVIGAGAKPRARRSTRDFPSMTRTTESSTRLAILAIVNQRVARRCRQVARRASSSSMICGSSETLPLVITTGRVDVAAESGDAAASSAA